MTDPMSRLTAALADRYAIERKLGAGGMATVWLARDLKYGRPVALKVLQTELASRIGVERFVQEIAIAARLTHPHVLPLFESGEAAGALYYTMPCVTGETLRDRLRRERQLPLEDVLEITRAVAEALDYAHREGVVHRDIKPENILFQEGQALVADFGVARALAVAADDRLTTPGVPIGTVHYMSPEQAAGDRAVDARSDIYSLGCVAYEMLAGVPPFQGATAESVLRQHVTGEPPSLTPHRPDLADSVDGAVRRALAKTPADRWQTGAAFVEALAASRARAGTRRRRRVGALAVLGLVAVAAGGLAGSRLLAGHRGLDANLVAVAPFEVLEPRLAQWREGLMTALERDLDGAGPLRAVSAEAVPAGGARGGDRAAALDLGRRAGAGLVVFGALVPSGADSVRLTVSVADVASGRVLATADTTGAPRLDRLAEQETIRLLGEIGRSRRPGAGPRGPLESGSLPAVKEFLVGEHYFRRAEWDSAAPFYEHAIALDSTFALAISRSAWVHGLQGGFPGSEALDMQRALRAARWNHGLSPRDSLLLVIDSLRAAFYGFHSADERAYRALRRRFNDALWAAAGDRFGPDGELWFRAAEAVWYWWRLVEGVDRRQLLEAYDEAIGLDSGFAPAYPHAIALALLERGPEAARRYAAAYLKVGPQGRDAGDIRRMDSLLEASGRAPGPALRPLAGADAGLFSRAGDWLRYWPDSAETAVRLYRAVAAGGAPGDQSFWPKYNVERLALALAYRGHVRESWRLAPDWLRASLARLGGTPPDSAATIFDAWLRTGGLWPFGLPPIVLPWWSARGDTASLELFIRRADSLARPRGHDPAEVEFGRNVGRRARAYLSLARGDTTNALSLFMTIPDSASSGACSFCFEDRLIKARLLEARGGSPAAVRLLGDLRLEAPQDVSPLEALWALEWGRVNERLGRTAEARRGYEFTAAVWLHADSALQPYVAEAKAGLARVDAAARERPAQ